MHAPTPGIPSACLFHFVFSYVLLVIYSGNEEDAPLSTNPVIMENHKQMHAPKDRLPQCLMVILLQSQLHYSHYIALLTENHRKVGGEAFLQSIEVQYWNHYACVPQINTYVVKEKDMGHKARAR